MAPVCTVVLSRFREFIFRITLDKSRFLLYFLLNHNKKLKKHFSYSSYIKVYAIGVCDTLYP